MAHRLTLLAVGPPYIVAILVEVPGNMFRCLILLKYSTKKYDVGHEK